MHSSHDSDDVALDRRAVRGTLWVGLSSWLNRLTMLVVIAVLARTLDPLDFGVLSIGALCSNILTILGSLGLADALVYQRDRVKEAAGTSLTLALAAGVIIGAALVVVAPWVATFFRAPDATDVIRAYGAMVTLNVVKQVPFSLLTRDLRFDRRFVPEAVPAVIGGIVSIVLALGGTGVWSLVIGDAVRSLLSLILSFTSLQSPLRPSWHPEVAAEMWHYGKHVLATQGFDFALQNVDYVLVGRLLGPVALGYYSLAFRIAIMPFLTITYVIAGVAFPYFSRMAPNRERVHEVFRSTFGVSMGLICVFGGGLAALAPSLQVLGTEWAPSVPVARWLGIYVCLRSGAHLIHALLTSSGRPGVDASLRGVWVVLLVIGIATFGRRGITEVGIVQAVVAAALLVAYVAAGSSYVGLKAREIAGDLGRQALITAVAAAVVLSLRLLGGVWADDTSWVTLLLLGSVFAVTYVLATIAIAPGLIQDLRRLRARVAS